MLKKCQWCSETFKSFLAAKRKFCSRQCWRESINKKVRRICETCGKEFWAKRYKVKSGGGRFCSRECANAGWKEPCEYCGNLVHCTPFHATKFRHIFCSQDCYGLWKRNRVECVCKHCGKSFHAKSSKITEGAGKYCSIECYNAARAQKFIALTCEMCGKEFELPESSIGPYMYQGRFCSSQCTAIARRLPDSVRSVYNHEFSERLKERIRERDNKTCQLCGTTEQETYRKLDVHHIDYDRAHNHSANLITLCGSCHSKTNYNRPYWQQHLSTIML